MSEAPENFEQHANLFMSVCQAKLAYLVSKEIEAEYLGENDSAIQEGKITLPSKALLANIPLSDLDTSVVIHCDYAVVGMIADLLAGTPGEGEDLSEGQKTVFLETLEQCVSTSLQFLMSKAKALKLNCGAMTSQVIESDEPHDLELLGEMDALAFSVKFIVDNTADIDFVVNIDRAKFEEVSSTLTEAFPELDIDSLVEELQPELNAENPEEEAEEGASEDAAEPGLGGEGKQDALYNVDEQRNLGFVSDVNLDLIVELGRVDMEFTDVLNLTKGSAIELDRHCSEPVDLYVHNQLVARGEVIAIDDCFGLKVTQIMNPLDLSKAV